MKHPAPTTLRNRYVLAIDDGVDAFAIPSELHGRLCEFLSDGSDCDILFGTATTVSVTYGQVSAVHETTKVITPNSGSGGHLVSKVAKRYRVPLASEATHFAVDCVGSGSGKLYIEIVD